MMRWLVRGLVLSMAVAARAGEVPYALGPHASFSLPEGWIVCDQDTGKETANAMPEEKEKPGCETQMPGHAVMRNSDHENPALVFLAVGSDAAYTRTRFAGLSQDKQNEYGFPACLAASRTIGFSFDSCDVSVADIGGVQALYCLAKGKPGGSPVTAVVRVMTLPYDGGFVSFIGAAPEGYPAIDRLAKSFVLQ